MFGCVLKVRVICQTCALLLLLVLSFVIVVSDVIIISNLKKNLYLNYKQDLRIIFSLLILMKLDDDDDDD